MRGVMEPVRSGADGTVNHWDEMKRQSSHFWMQLMAAVFVTVCGTALVVRKEDWMGLLFVGMGFYFLFMAREEYESPRKPKP